MLSRGQRDVPITEERRLLAVPDRSGVVGEGLTDGLDMGKESRMTRRTLFAVGRS